MKYCAASVVVLLDETPERASARTGLISPSPYQDGQPFALVGAGNSVASTDSRRPVGFVPLGDAVVSAVTVRSASVRRFALLSNGSPPPTSTMLPALPPRTTRVGNRVVGPITVS